MASVEIRQRFVLYCGGTDDESREIDDLFFVYWKDKF